MRPFSRLEAVAVPVWRANVDTDAIIPIAYCVNRKRPHFDEGLFRRWRYDESGAATDFVLNDPRYANAEILIGGVNFGCGSSREMAVWALVDHGIRCVIAPSFGEIFFNNCFQNGVLPIRAPADAVAEMVRELGNSDPPRMSVDLEAQSLVTAEGRKLRFEINPLRREALLRGLDPIEATLSQADAIDAFQARDRERRPWIYSPGAE